MFLKYFRLHSQNIADTAETTADQKSVEKQNAASPNQKAVPVISSLSQPVFMRPPSSSADIVEENHNKRPKIGFTTFLSAPPENNEDLDCLDDIDF